MKNVSGVSFIEVILYVAIISMVMVAFVSLALNLRLSYNKLYITQEVQFNMKLALKVIGEQIRSASSIDYAGSVLGSDPGILSLNMKNASSTPVIFKLDQDDGILYFSEGSGYFVPVTSRHLKVSKLIFNNISATTTKNNIAIDIKIESSGESRDTYYDEEITTSYTFR